MSVSVDQVSDADVVLPQREMGHTNPDAGRISQVLEHYVFRRYVVVDLRPERGTFCHIVLGVRNTWLITPSAPGSPFERRN
jgi:hypothetical protein